MKSLSPRVSNSLLASVQIPTLHLAVERAVANSLKAGSNRIAVILNPSNFYFAVIDNGITLLADDFKFFSSFISFIIFTTGCGIPCTVLERLASPDFCQQNGNYRHFISTLGFIASVDILSKTKGTPTVYQMSRHSDRSTCALQSCVECAVFQPDGQGTIIHVREIFQSIPVRQKALRLDEEIALLSNFIRHMSVLHHTVSWSFSLGSTESVFSSKSIKDFRSLLSIYPRRSVVKQLIFLYGIACLDGVQVLFVIESFGFR